MAVLTKADLLDRPGCSAAVAAIQEHQVGPWAALGLGWCAVASPSVRLPQALLRWQADRLEGASFIGQLIWGALDCSRLGAASVRHALSTVLASAGQQQQQQQQLAEAGKCSEEQVSSMVCHVSVHSFHANANPVHLNTLVI
jgi:hypothetical protein